MYSSVEGQGGGGWAREGKRRMKEGKEEEGWRRKRGERQKAIDHHWRLTVVSLCSLFFFFTQGLKPIRGRQIARWGLCVYVCGGVRVGEIGRAHV